MDRTAYGSVSCPCITSLGRKAFGQFRSISRPTSIPPYKVSAAHLSSAGDDTFQLLLVMVFLLDLSVSVLSRNFSVDPNVHLLSGNLRLLGH